MPTDYTNLPSNSKAAKKQEAEKKDDIQHAKPIAEGKVVEDEQKGGFIRLLRIFFAMGLKEMWAHVKKEVLLPSARNMAHDIGSNALDLLLYGDGTTPTVSGSQNIPYNEIRSKPVNGTAQAPKDDYASTTAQNYKILLKTYAEAESVKKDIATYIGNYGKVTVGYVRELVRLSTAWPDYQSGWTSIDGSHISQSREGWTLTLPKPKSLD